MQSPNTIRETYARDGIVYLPGALSPATLKLAERLYSWSLEHPGPGAAKLPANGDGTFYQDLANPEALDVYAPLVRQPDLANIVTDLFGQANAWFMYEQVFLKENGMTRRTPWHQDTPYLPVEGDDLVVMWITFDAVPAPNALEFVKGSHHGPLYDGSRFDPDDDTAPLYGTGELPQLPDIEATRDQWNIVSWDVTPGDVLLFHPSILHGGAPTHAGLRRRTLSLRFFGADARVAARPGSGASPREADSSPEGAPVSVSPETGSGAAAESRQANVHPLTGMRRKAAGTPFRDPAFPEIRPEHG